MRALGKSTLESKGDGDSERRCKSFPMRPDFCMTLRSSAERTGAIVLVGCVVFMQQEERGSGREHEEHPRAPVRSLLREPLKQHPA
jgi:hypothetical protein